MGKVSLKGVEQAVIDTARALFSMLVAKCEGKAFGIVQLCLKGNGLEAWRRLKDEYEGRSGNRLAALLPGILNPRERWNKNSDNNREFFESLNDWEILIGEYRAASEENVSDRVLIATILGKKGKGKEGTSNGKHVKGKVKSEKESGNEKVEATYMLRRCFRATVGTARNGDINVLIVGKTTRARTNINIFGEISVSVAKVEFCKRGAGCYGRTFRGGVEGRQMVLCIGDRFELSSGQG